MLSRDSWAWSEHRCLSDLMASMASSARFCCFITIAMSFKALSTLSPELMAAQNSGIAFSGSLSTSYWKTKSTHHQLEPEPKQEKRTISRFLIQILKRTQKIYLNILGSNIRSVAYWDFVSHMKRLGPGPRNSKWLGWWGRGRLGGSETRRSIPHILQHL